MATLQELQEELAELKATAKTIRTGGQSYGSGRNNLNRVDYASIKSEIKDLERRIALVQNGGRLPASHVVFRG